MSNTTAINNNSTSSKRSRRPFYFQKLLQTLHSPPKPKDILPATAQPQPVQQAFSTHQQRIAPTNMRATESSTNPVSQWLAGVAAPPTPNVRIGYPLSEFYDFSMNF